MEGSIETQQYEFIEDFGTKNVLNTAYLVPKNMGRKIIQHKQFPV